MRANSARCYIRQAKTQANSMDSLRDMVDMNQNIVRLLRGREINCDHGKTLRNKCQFTAELLKRLHLEHHLEGHQGCVNCLQWTADGLHLASGSDDTVVRIWDPFAKKCLHVVPTKHIGNIFSVKFVSDDNMIATCAGDCRVIVQSIEDTGKQAIMDCSCHAARVKRLATAPDCPTLFWSAGEDGLVIQYDLREPHECTKNATAFLDLFTTEFKCIAVNPTKTHLIAVGANDAYVRLYDRRFVKTSKITINHAFDARKRTPAEPQDPTCVQYFSPGHLARDHVMHNSFRHVATYIAFDATGKDLLVNMGGDHVYLYDVNNSRNMDELSRPDWLPKIYQHGCTKACCNDIRYEPMPLLAKTETQKTAEPENDKFIDGNPCACDYIARAKHLMQRRYIGDAYLAARDFVHVIKHWPEIIAGYLGLVECLIALKWTEEAQNWMTYFQQKFATHASDKVVKSIAENLKTLNCVDDVEQMEVQEDADISPIERALRLESRDYETRYLGHCNTTTDIKEANFMGDDGNFICAGSDDGMIFFWDRKSTKLLTAVIGDTSIVNCVQPHPSICYLASSGIDSGVKIWSPMNEDKENFKNLCAVRDLWTEVECNQDRMAMDPFDTLMISMGFREVRTTRSSAGEVTHSTCRTC